MNSSDPISSPILQIKNLEFTYSGNENKTLDIPEFSVQKGEKIFLFGPSGSGKTTLLEILSGVLVPTKGSVQVAGKKFEQLSNSERDAFRAEHLGYVFQNFNLIPYLSVSENIELPLHLSKERRAKLEAVDISVVTRALCGSLGISNLLDKKVTELSVGQQQRVAVARALIGKPDIILADEPTSALDYDHREKFLKILFEVAQLNGTTIIFVSHDRGIEKLFERQISLSSINRAV